MIKVILNEENEGRDVRLLVLGVHRVGLNADLGKKLVEGSEEFGVSHTERLLDER